MNRLVIASLTALAVFIGPGVALAQTPVAPPQAPAEAAQAANEAAIEAAAAAFEARMEGFGKRAEAIANSEGLSETQRAASMGALWGEYQPEVAVFTAALAQHTSAIAAAALADVDLKAIVDEALTSPDVQSAMAGAQGMATNGAWAQADPEQMITYGLMAQYGLDQAMDAVETGQGALEAASAAEAAAARVAPPPEPSVEAAPEPPEPPASPRARVAGQT